MSVGLIPGDLTPPQAIAMVALAGLAVHLSKVALRIVYDRALDPWLRRRGLVNADTVRTVCLGCGKLTERDDYIVVCDKGCHHPLCMRCSIRYAAGRDAKGGA